MFVILPLFVIAVAVAIDPTPRKGQTPLNNPYQATVLVAGIVFVVYGWLHH